MRRLVLWMICGCLLLSAMACGGPGKESSAPAPVDTGTATSTTTATSTATTTAPSSTATATTTRITETGEQTPALSDYALAQAEYTVDESRIYKGTGDGLTAYYSRVLPVFLEESGQNRVCSPLNVYLALGMLTELAEGSTREELLSLLGETDVAALQKRCAALWNTLYREEDTAKCLLANSLWLNEGGTYRDTTVRRLAEEYYASVFRGRMGSEGYNQALRTWINDNTDGVLKQQADKEKFDANTVLGLVSAVYFKINWQRAFDVNRTREETFYTATGMVTCPFMNASQKDTYYWEGENFTAIKRPMDEGFAMWFLLPEEGVRPDVLLGSREALATLTGGNGAQRVNCDLYTKVPKFDITSGKKLMDSLQTLGVTEVFTPGVADLSAMFGEDGKRGAYWVSGVNHSARIIAAEDGVEAAAYTGMTVAMKGTSTTKPKRKVVYFHATRPFMFAVTGPQDTLLFAGVVENPTQK